MTRGIDDLRPDDDLADEPTPDEPGVRVGERIKNIRTEKGISLQDLADKTGFSAALLSQIENHMVSPPLGALIKIARALDAELGRFLDEMHDVPYTIVRKDERKIMSHVASKQGVSYGYSYESLAFDKKGRHMEPFLVTLEPANVKHQSPNTHQGEEFIFVLEGRMQVHLGEHTDILEPGDCIYLDSTMPHRVECMDDKETKILACIFTGQKVE